MMLRGSSSVGLVALFAIRSVLAAGVLAVPLLGGCQGVSDKSIEDMTGLELRRLVDEAGRERNSATLLLIDPRNQREFEAERIPGARNIRLADIPPDARKTEGMSRFETIVVYGTNPASATAKAMTKRLITIGYSGVRYFPGGLEEWKSLGGEVETGK